MDAAVSENCYHTTVEEKNRETSSVVLGNSERLAGQGWAGQGTAGFVVTGETSVIPSPHAGTPKTGGVIFVL